MLSLCSFGGFWRWYLVKQTFARWPSFPHVSHTVRFLRNKQSAVLCAVLPQLVQRPLSSGGILLRVWAPRPRCDRGWFGVCVVVTTATTLAGLAVNFFSSFNCLSCWLTSSLIAVRSLRFYSKSFSLGRLSLHPAMNLKAVRSSLSMAFRSAMSPVAVMRCR